MYHSKDHDITIHKVTKNMLGDTLHFSMKLMDVCVRACLKCIVEGIYSWKQRIAEAEIELDFITYI